MAILNNENFFRAIIISIAGLIALVIFRIVRLAFFHPCAKYPGPFLAKFSNLYAAYHGWKGDIHLDMWRCHERYGTHVRYGPNKLLFNTAEALQDIYNAGRSGNFIKATQYVPLVHRTPNTLTMRNSKSHARRRRLLAQGVSEKAQRSYEHRVLSHIDAFCCRLFPSITQQEVWGDERDMSRWCYYLSFDIMTDVVFGAHYRLLESEEFRYLTDAIDESNKRMSTLMQMPELAAWKWEKHLFRRAIRARNQFVRFVVRIVKERAARAKSDAGPGIVPNEKDDVFAHLAAATDPETGQGLRADEVHAESTTLIVAGSDTTSTAFSGLFFYLARNPSAYEKAASEVRRAFGGREEIVMGAKLGACTYLRACIDEALRMSPSVGLALLREVLPGNATVDTEVVSAGCDVGVPIYSIHHNPAYFADPFAYKPDRWLIDDGTGSVERARAAFNPFSIGTRGCLGKGLAYTELMLTMATVLYLGDFRIAGGEAQQGGGGHGGAEYGRHRPHEYQLWDYVTAQKEGPTLQFMRRA